MTDISPDALRPTPATDDGSDRPDWKRLFGLREMGVYYALVLLVLILAVVTTWLGRANYLSLLNLTNVIYQSSLIAMMAVAMTVVLITGNFDLSVASVAALGAVVLVGSANALGFWPAMVLAVGVCALVGLFNGMVVQFIGINAFIVTLGTMTGVRGIILLITDGYALNATDPGVVAAMRAFESGRLDILWLVAATALALLAFGVVRLIRDRAAGRPLRPAVLGMICGGVALGLVAFAAGGELRMPKPVIYLFVFTGIVWFVLSFTMVGRRTYAVGANPEAARLSGIAVTKYKLMAFVLCSATAGFAGVLFASRLRSVAPNALTAGELTVIAAAILGGTSLFGGAGSVIKTVAGALLLFTLTNGFNMLNLGANWQPLIQGAVIIVAAAIYTVGNARAKHG